MRAGRVVDLGRSAYAETWALQKRLLERRQADAIPDLLLLVEHPDVITVGRRLASQGNIIQPGDIPVFEIERGGDVTYHGPGQLVGYPILKLDGDERDLHGYLRRIEEGLIGVCADFGLRGERRPAYTGVWLGERKVASIGISVRRWVTMHGFALNVATDLAKFFAINPCGFQPEIMTSLSEAGGRAVTVAAAAASAIARLGAALGRDFRPATLAELDAAA